MSEKSPFQTKYQFLSAIRMLMTWDHSKFKFSGSNYAHYLTAPV